MAINLVRSLNLTNVPNTLTSVEAANNKYFQSPSVLVLKRDHWLHLSEPKWPGMALLN